MSNDNKVQVRSGGIGLGGLLFVVFLVLKLGIGNTSVMGWSWWWVCSPLWLPVVAVLGIAIAVLVIGIIIATIAALCRR